MSSNAPAAPTRRDRLRAQTESEIKAAARQQLIDQGRDGVSLRAVARAVGLTAPALYRYFPGLDELLLALTADLYDELTEQLEAARDSDPQADVFERMLQTSRAFRRWGVAHPAEFGLVFATPQGSFAHAPATPCESASSRFGNVFAGLFLEIWETHPFPVEPVETMAPDLVENLSAYHTWLTETLAPTIPMGAVVIFLEDWVRLYGTVAMEVFGHLSWAVPDGAAMFEQTMRSMAASVHRSDAYRPPNPPRR
jgi:AcrR family transcriptional regulator